MKTLHSDYEVLEKIGQGSQGITFKARHTPTGDLVAIKVMDFGAVSDWKDVELFEREAAALEKLSHPSIPRYIDTWTLEEDGSLQMCLAQQFIEGQNLRQELSKGGKWTGKQALDALEQLLQTLVYLHNRVPPVIHRDIKPSNIIRKHNGELILADFGAVQTQQHGTVGGSTVIGTPGYMPMEQMIGQAEPRSDLYALGVTVGRMLTGLEPSKTPLTKNRFDFRAQLQHIDSDTHRALTVIEGLTQPSKEDRFPSASAALDALQAPQLAQPPAPQTLPLPQDPTTELHGHPTKHASDFEPWFEAVRDWIHEAKTGDHTKGQYTVLDRPCATTLSPQLQDLVARGFEFVGRQTALHQKFTHDFDFAIINGTETTHSAWRSPDGIIYAIADEQTQQVELVTPLDNGGIITLALNDAEEMPTNTPAETQWRLQKMQQQIVSAKAAPIVGLDMDRLMAIHDITWFKEDSAFELTDGIMLNMPPGHPGYDSEDRIWRIFMSVYAISIVLFAPIFWLFTRKRRAEHQARYQQALAAIKKEHHGDLSQARIALPPLSTAPEAHLTLPDNTTAAQTVPEHTQVHTH